jgi:hypothetical protein
MEGEGDGVEGGEEVHTRSKVDGVRESVDADVLKVE